MIGEPVLVIFHGAVGVGEAERLVGRARVAAARRSTRVALAAGYASVVVVTDEPEAFEELEGVVVDADVAGAPFSYAGRLEGVVARHGLTRPVVMGSGALPLLDTADFAAIADGLRGDAPAAVTNNFFSGDVTGWTPGDAIGRIGAFERDNMLPRRLRDGGGMAVTVLPRTTATQFDIDTPTDLAILSLDEELPVELADILDGERLPRAALRRVMPLFCDRTAEVIVAGRVGSQAWQHMERETACRVRMFSEERGMAAAGPGHRARSLLGFALEDAGPDRFFARMTELGDALVLDCRVIEAHLGLDPSREDRYQADMGNADAIEDGQLKEFVAAAGRAPIPVVMGGHSLVAGGLMLLNDLAWLENDRTPAAPF